MTERLGRRPPVSAPARRRRNILSTVHGLTLLEMLLSISLIVLLVGAMFGFYNVSLDTRERGRRLVETSARAQRMVEHIAQEVRSANGFVPRLGPGITGLKHEITLQTVALTDRELFERRSIREKPPPAQSDVREVRYYLAIDPEQQEDYSDPDDPESMTSGPRTIGLVRREVKTLRQATTLGDRPEEVDLDLLSDELRYLRFRYFDGVDWVDIWQPPPAFRMGNSLPQAVEITVGYAPVLPEDPNELDFDEEDRRVSLPEPHRPDRYTAIVRLNQADVFLGSRLLRASRRAASAIGGDSGPSAR